MKYLFKSARLGFRNWIDSDIPLMTKISADPQVMKNFPSVATPTQTAEFIQRMQIMFAENGFCYFAVDSLDDNSFIGFIGLSHQDYDVEFTPCIDIGWRLSQKYWGKGFATEGAKRCLEYAFEDLGIENIKSTAPLVNLVSIKVMEKIGMKKQIQFKHPKLLDIERLVNCVCYQISPDKTNIAVAVFDKLAQLYEDKFMDVSQYHQSFDVFCNAVTSDNPEVLELACGPGNITKHLLQKRPDLNILATDLAPNMISLAKKNNPLASFQILDSRKINDLSKNFDGIMCGFVLPYLSKKEVQLLILNASQRLNLGGIIYLSTMEDDFSKSKLTTGSTGDKIFMHYYLEQDLIPILKENNFDILKIERVSTPDHPTNDLIIIAKLHD
jgi:RimJ/RimL family protein N-acetyltransferase/2-polyprenyl-3-methyl-5-hydroxy-6-metoxy-1,4-benzoquinol methylase